MDSHRPTTDTEDAQRRNLLNMRSLPTAHLASCFVKNSFVVPLANLLAYFGSQLFPKRLILVIDLQIFFLSGRSNFVGAEEKAIWIATDHSRRVLYRLGRRDHVLRHFIPGNVEMNVSQLRIADDLFDDCGLLFHWTNDSPDADMRPDKRRVGMTLEQGLHLGRISRLSAGLCKRNVNIVVNKNDQTNFSSEVEQTIERRILKARYLTRDLCGNKFLVNAEFADTAENTGENGEHAANVIRGIHVRWIEARDHRIEAALLFFRE